MNIAVPAVTAPPAGVIVVRSEKDLERFRDAASAAVVWDRSLPPDVSSMLADLRPEMMPDGRVVLQVKAVADAVRCLCDDAGMPAGKLRDWLAGDIAALAHSFAGLMRADYVRLRLQAVSTNACRRFHVDAITGRLVCTYRGTGTQYGASHAGGEPEHVCTVPTGAPVLLRGSLWPPKPAAGILHRSPPIEGTGETRLVLVLDPVFDPEDHE